MNNEAIEFCVKLALQLYEQGFRDGITSKEPCDSSRSYLSGYKDGQAHLD